MADAVWDVMSSTLLLETPQSCCQYEFARARDRDRAHDRARDRDRDRGRAHDRARARARDRARDRACDRDRRCADTSAPADPAQTAAPQLPSSCNRAHLSAANPTSSCGTSTPATPRLGECGLWLACGWLVARGCYLVSCVSFLRALSRRPEDPRPCPVPAFLSSRAFPALHMLGPLVPVEHCGSTDSIQASREGCLRDYPSTRYTSTHRKHPTRPCVVSPEYQHVQLLNPAPGSPSAQQHRRCSCMSSGKASPPEDRGCGGCEPRAGGVERGWGPWSRARGSGSSHAGVVRERYGEALDWVRRAGRGVWVDE